MKFTKWFQNLNENKKYLFHFRGDFSVWYKKNGRDKNFRLLKYEFCSGPSLRLEFSSKDEDSGLSISLGLLFFTAYLTIPFFKIADERRLIGFYVHEWAIVWNGWKNPWEGSTRDPWYRSFYFRVDDFFLGQRERLEDEMTYENDIYFKLGDKEFKIDHIKFEKNRTFRRFIPYSLYHKTWYSVDIKIDKPPMYSGKGENSYDCGDEGTFGVSCGWNGPIPSWNNRTEITKLATKMYVDGVLKDAGRYGGSSSERGIDKNSVYEYIGPKRIVEENACSSECGAAHV